MHLSLDYGLQPGCGLTSLRIKSSFFKEQPEAPLL
jgi:hypothetical protein